MASEVYLHVYDLQESFKVANSVMKGLGTGVYHCAVEVFGREWSFGMNDRGTGVYYCEPKGNTSHYYRQSIPMGPTKLSRREVSEMIQEMKPLWIGKDYTLLYKNCCDFSGDLCRGLDVGQLPGWLRSAAGAGGRIEAIVQLKPLVSAIDEGKKARGVPPEHGYRFGDFTRGVASATFVGTERLVKLTASAGKVARQAAEAEAEPTEGYQVGDLTRGAAHLLGQHFSSILAEGKQARDATPSDEGYRFGDVTRGMIASIGRR